jgi:peroxiredoxin family protein
MENNKLSMVVFSGDMDKLMAAFIIATGAAASGMEVTMFFTFWGLQAIKKRERTGKSFFGRLLGFMLKDIKRCWSEQDEFRWNRSLDVQENDEGEKCCIIGSIKRYGCSIGC